MSSVIEQKEILSKVVNPVIKLDVGYSENVFKIEEDGLMDCNFIGCKYDTEKKVIVLVYNDIRKVVLDNFLNSDSVLLDAPAVVDRFDVVGIPLLRKNGNILPYNDDRIESWVFSNPYVVKLLNDVYSFGDEYVLEYVPERSVFTPIIDVGVVPQDTIDIYADVYFYDPLIVDMKDVVIEEKCVSDENGIIELSNNVLEVYSVREYVSGKVMIDYSVSGRKVNVGMAGVYVINYKTGYVEFRYDFRNFYELYWSGTNGLNQMWSQWKRVENGGRLNRYRYYRLWFRMLKGFDKELCWIKSFSIKLVNKRLYV